MNDKIAHINFIAVATKVPASQKITFSDTFVENVSDGCASRSARSSTVHSCPTRTLKTKVTHPTITTVPHQYRGNSQPK